MKISRKIIIPLLILIVAMLIATICFLFWQKEKPAPDAQPPETNITKLPKIKSAKILFVGDLMFDRGIRYYADKNGGNDFIFEKIKPTLSDNDLVVANLEGPITDYKSISSGTIPGSANNYIFTFDASVASTLFKNNIKIVSLGNNHILNFGRDGLAQTKKYLDEAGVDYFGAPDYPKSISTEIGDIKITFISYNEFSAIGDIEAQSTIEEIQRAREYSDVIIVFSHWGAEYSLVSSDLTKNLAHSLIDAGADLIIGSHPHVIQEKEEYNGKTIYYSLGNFIFDQYFDEDVRNGLGVIVKINKNIQEGDLRLEFEEKKFYLQDEGQTIMKE